MSSVLPADSTYAQIERTVRELTGCPGESTLKSTYIQTLTNTIYSQNMPNAIKTDQMRSVYEFFTKPYVDRYPLDVNYNQSIRAPVYVDGIQGSLFKDRQQFYSVWPNFPTQMQPATGDGTTVVFNFTVPGPLLRNSITIGCLATSGAEITISDDGNGTLYSRTANPQTSVPAANQNPGIPGMLNTNLNNPGLINSISCGSVNYVTGVFAINLTPTALVPEEDAVFNLWVTQYQPGRPYCVLFWNNEFIIRPVPKLVHKITVETYLTPVQFMLSTDCPIMNHWWQYIAYCVATEVLRRRMDMDGVAALKDGLMYQEGLVLERQASEEIGKPNITIFNSYQQQYINGNVQGGYY